MDTAGRKDGPTIEQKVMGFGCLAVVGLVLFVSVCSRGGSKSDKPSEAMAGVMAERFVKESLKSPSTANFGDRQVKDLGNNTFRVTGWVDAQNAFGATVRADYVVKLRYAGGDRWELVEPTKLDQR